MVEKLEAYYLGEGNIKRFQDDLFRAGKFQTFRSRMEGNGTCTLMNDGEVPIAHISRDGYLIIKNPPPYTGSEMSLLRRVAEGFKTN